MHVCVDGDTTGMLSMTPTHPQMPVKPARTYAGVLPYAVNADDTVVVLLGKEAYGKDVHKWSGFGGGVCGDESVVDAAIRECYEELNGVLPVTPDVLTAAAGMRLQSGGVQFLVHTAFDAQAPAKFAAVHALIRAEVGPRRYSPYLEKSEVQWVPLDTAQQSHTLRSVFVKDLPTVSRLIHTRLRRAAPIRHGPLV